MKIQRAYLYLTLILVLVLMTACERNVPGGDGPGTEPAGTEQASGTETIPVPSQMYIFQTQTAIATQGAGPGPSGPTAQTTPGGPTAPQTTQSAPSPAVTAPPAAAPTQGGQPGPQQPVVVATAPPLVVPDSYTLQTGEFPFCIARRFNIDPGALLRVNGLSSYSVYYAGMTLRIPKGQGGFPGRRALMDHPTSYSVRAGDTLSSIACAFGDVDPNAIAVVNNLTPPYRLAAGTVLQIP
jgi:LysM repeat protein